MKRNKIAQNDPQFPKHLLRLDQVPEAIYWRGSHLEQLLERPIIAIVGSRKVSSYGQQVTTKLATELSRSGVVIISGLALGVDSIAHTAALEANGQTIAVLPCGIDTVYPASHFGLAKRILQTSGALLSEYDGREMPMKHQFIARNRLIAALADGVLITEAAAKSGSLHTAEFALELGIDVFAVPGNITSPTSEGTNNLIKNGAMAVTAASDILDALNIIPQAATQMPEQLSTDEQIIVSLLKQGITDTTLLQIESQLPTDRFNQCLSTLEIQGLIAISGNSVSVR